MERLPSVTGGRGALSKGVGVKPRWTGAGDMVRPIPIEGDIVRWDGGAGDLNRCPGPGEICLSIARGGGDIIRGAGDMCRSMPRAGGAGATDMLRGGERPREGAGEFPREFACSSARQTLGLEGRPRIDKLRDIVLGVGVAPRLKV